MARKPKEAAAPARSAVTEVTAPALPPKLKPPLNRFVRWVINLCVLLHFAAVLTAAGSVGPTSDLIVEVWKPFRPYLQFLYLNQGYNFYAPQPAPSTLVKYEVERSDGSIAAKGSILEMAMTPRLLYHRHLLLTEHLVFVSQESQQHWYRSYARHLCHKYGGSKVSLTRRVHYPATMEMIRDGMGLDAPMSYEEVFVGEFPCGD
jgi:hypothetical protein